MVRSSLYIIFFLKQKFQSIFKIYLYSHQNQKPMPTEKNKKTLV